MANSSINKQDQGQVLLDNIWQLIAQLPGELRLRLRSRLDDELRAEAAQSPAPSIAPIVPPEEFATKWEQNRRWLEQHQAQYAGQWVALDGDRLIASGSSARDVYAALKAAGISGSLVLRVEAADDLSALDSLPPYSYVPKAIDSRAAVKLLESFYDESETEQRETWGLLQNVLATQRP